jgi:ribose 1,5-bisphosphokinase PhnN
MGEGGTLVTGVAVLLTGASASGKSRLIAGSTGIAAAGGVLPDLKVAKRYTTRAPRVEESMPGENRHVSAAEFDESVRSGLIDVSWRRLLGPGHENRYGFALTRELASGGAVVLSGNNYLRWPRDPLLLELRAEGRLMVVRVMATQATRRARLEARRPRLTEQEMASRMTDLSARLLPPADHVIPNDPEFQRQAEWEFLQLVAAFRFATGGWGVRRQAVLV